METQQGEVDAETAALISLLQRQDQEEAERVSTPLHPLPSCPW